ncbi:MAG: hypothetical protein CYPHOPRED_005370 [Cyphobasidiales sp. Tagirdzhanova-0007]|nr:MAG: hypothetical protein CYPHOPRED_005370 [Cyphobasidiales sp. Tagirdzhanova-0007]
MAMDDILAKTHQNCTGQLQSKVSHWRFSPSWFPQLHPWRLSVHSSLADLAFWASQAGSSICKAFVERGWAVISLSRNGEPSYPSRTKPAWAEKVEWIRGSAFDDAALRSLMPSVTAVVHTLGILLETDYKSGGLSSLALGVAKGLQENYQSYRRHANPLAVQTDSPARTEGAYEKINRDSAEAVLRAYLATKPTHLAALGGIKAAQRASPFVYISAEDTFRPFVPERYILTKREAENRIQRLSETARSMLQASHEGHDENNDFESIDTPQRLVRPIFIRPSIIYNPRVRPGSAIPATVLGLSSRMQSLMPAPLQASTAASIFSALTASQHARTQQDLPSSAESLANLLSIPPIHAETVAEAVCRSIEDEEMGGVVAVKDMQAMTGVGRSQSRPRPEPAGL